MNDTQKRIGRLEARISHHTRRLAIVEDDLDCDMDGSIAQALGDLRDEVSDLRARIEEWEPRAATDERRTRDERRAA